MSEDNIKQPNFCARRGTSIAIFVGTLFAGVLFAVGGFVIGHRANSTENKGIIEVGSINVMDEALDGEGVQDILGEVDHILHQREFLPNEQTIIPNDGDALILSCLDASGMDVLRNNSDCLSADEIETIFPRADAVRSFHTNAFLLPPLSDDRRMSETSQSTEGAFSTTNLTVSEIINLTNNSVNSTSGMLDLSLNQRRRELLGPDDVVVETNHTALVPVNLLWGNETGEMPNEVMHYTCNAQNSNCTMVSSTEHGRELRRRRRRRRRRSSVFQWICKPICKKIKRRGVWNTVCNEVCTRIKIVIKIVFFFFFFVCFPANAQVHVLSVDGRTHQVPISAVAPGTLVLTPSGFEEVYFQTHANLKDPAIYMDIGLDGDRSIALSPDHFFRLDDGSHVLAKDVVVGMAAIASVIVNGSIVHSASARVVSVTKRVLKGAYNPLTPSGLIIVDGVHSSCHSSWLLEQNSLISHSSIPAIYQILFAPVQAIWHAAPGLVTAFTEKHANDMGNLNAMQALMSVLHLATEGDAKSKADAGKALSSA